VKEIAERGAAVSLQDALKNVFSLSPACTIDVVFLSPRHQHLVAMPFRCCRSPALRIAGTDSIEKTGKRHGRQTGPACGPTGSELKRM